ncbi:MAG: carbon-nitrogen hydrolase family protein [Isosphaeraceae bacterium]
MKITIAQLVVGRDLVENKKRMKAVIESAGRGDWVIFPEGVLSGYFPDDDQFLQTLDSDKIEKAISAIQEVVQARQCHCIFGSATFADNIWRNTVITATASGQGYRYHKIELSALDRLRFEPGTVSEVIQAGDLTIGVLACRELLFPGMWSKLKQAGAQIVFHINNAIQPHDRIWSHIFITRAIEQGMFVCSVNNGSPPQELASYLVAPSGQIVLKTETGQDNMVSAYINMSDSIPDLTKRTDF